MDRVIRVSGFTGRHRLLLASLTPEQLKTTGSLKARGASRFSWLTLGFVLGAAGLLLSRSLLEGLGFWSAWVLGLLPLVFFGLVGYIIESVYGKRRARNLRYAYYASLPEFQQSGNRRALAALDSYRLSAGEGSSETATVTGRPKNRWLPMLFWSFLLLLLFGVLLLLTASMALVSARDTLSFFILFLGAAAAIVLIFGLMVIGALRFARIEESIPATSSLRDIVENAYRLYPEPLALKET